LEDRANLDGANPSYRNAFCNLDGLIQIGRVYQVVAAQLLSGFSKRAVGDKTFSLSYPHRGGGRNRMQWTRTQILSLCMKIMGQLSGLFITLDVLLFSHRVFVHVN